MLGKFLDRLDGKLYASWQQETEKLVDFTHQGIERITFSPPTPKEIQEIKNTIAKLLLGNLSRQDYVQNMKTLNEQFTLLALNKEFNHPMVNDFIWHAQRSYTMLNGALLTEYNKYGEAILNPAGKEQKEEKSGMFANRLLGKGARNITDFLLETYETEAAPLFKNQVEKIKATQPITVLAPIDLAAQKGGPSFLEKKMGKENYAPTQSRVEIKTPEDAGVYLAEQVHGKAFEAYYSQVATLIGIRSTINKLSALGKTPAEIENEKQRLYREAGLSELQTKESKKYLDTLAKGLGFKNAKDLYNNFQQLDKPEGY